MLRIVTFSILGLLAFSGRLEAQDKPRLMVMPSTEFMNDKGVCRDVEIEGRKELDCDLNRLLSTDKEFSSVVTNVAVAFADRGFPMVDLESSIKNATEQRMMDMTAKRPIQSSMQDQIVLATRPDIKLELKSELSSVMGQRKLTLTINGVDVFTGKNVAPATFTSQPMAGVTTADLAKEVVVAMMPQLESRLMNHFRDMAANGRGVSMRFVVLETSELEDGLNTDVEPAGELMALADYLSDLVRKRALNGKVEQGAAGETQISFAEVRIPFAEDPNRFGNQLRSQFAKDLPTLQLRRGSARGPGDLYFLIDKK
ncbi:MAG: hypothetical protein RLZZ63_588 [Gemmatimonadota bacterium]|jgi:hypothetical protein